MKIFKKGFERKSDSLIDLAQTGFTVLPDKSNLYCIYCNKSVKEIGEKNIEKHLKNEKALFKKGN